MGLPEEEGLWIMSVFRGEQMQDPACGSGNIPEGECDASADGHLESRGSSVNSAVDLSRLISKVSGASRGAFRALLLWPGEVPESRPLPAPEVPFLASGGS